MTAFVIRLALLAFCCYTALGCDCPASVLQNCCVDGELQLDLSGESLVTFPASGLQGVEILENSSNPANSKQRCKHAVLLKANFQRLFEEPACNECVRSPRCGRRMLKLELFLDADLQLTGNDWLFNIGDSRTNNGWGGDGNTQIRDAEMQAVGKSIQFFNSDACAKQPNPLALSNVLQGARKVTLYVSNEHVRVVTDTGVDEWVCSSCLFALNGQSDAQGVNEDIYVGLHRVVSNLGRNGHGICQARVSWACPWC